MSKPVVQIRDHTGNFVCLNSPPQRIVSMVPSQTELLHALGLDEQVVGITKFCEYPLHWYRTKPKVGGTKNIHADRIHALKPDLIIANKEENIKEQIEMLRQDYPVFTTNVKNLTDALSMIQDIGILINKQDEALQICSQIKKAFSRLPANHSNKKALYLIWKDPYMAAGGDTFISDMMQQAGLTNVLQHLNRYPSVTLSEIKKLNPDIIILSSEPFPFSDKHINEFKTASVRSKIILADGTFFSWYGSRLQYAPAYFSTLSCQADLHENIHS